MTSAISSTAAKEILLFRADGSEATACDVAVWLDQHYAKSREIFEERGRADLSTWPEAPPGWHRRFHQHTSTYSPESYGRVYGVEYERWDRTGSFVWKIFSTSGPNKDDPRVLWRLWADHDYGQRRVDHGMFASFEEACAAVTTERCPWPPPLSLPQDYRRSDVVEILEAGRAWRDYAIELWRELRKHKDEESVRQLIGRIWPRPRRSRSRSRSVEAT